MWQEYQPVIIYRMFLPYLLYGFMMIRLSTINLPQLWHEIDLKIASKDYQINKLLKIAT